MKYCIYIIGVCCLLFSYAYAFAQDGNNPNPPNTHISLAPYSGLKGKIDSVVLELSAVESSYRYQVKEYDKEGMLSLWKRAYRYRDVVGAYVFQYNKENGYLNDLKYLSSKGYRKLVSYKNPKTNGYIIDTESLDKLMEAELMHSENTIRLYSKGKLYIDIILNQQKLPEVVKTYNTAADGSSSVFYEVTYTYNSYGVEKEAHTTINDTLKMACSETLFKYLRFDDVGNWKKRVKIVTNLVDNTTQQYNEYQAVYYRK